MTVNAFQLSKSVAVATVQFHGRYCIFNVDLTGSFCCDFEFSLQRYNHIIYYTQYLAPVNFHSSSNYS